MFKFSDMTFCINLWIKSPFELKSTLSFLFFRTLSIFFVILVHFFIRCKLLQAILCKDRPVDELKTIILSWVKCCSVILDYDDHGLCVVLFPVFMPVCGWGVFSEAGRGLPADWSCCSWHACSSSTHQLHLKNTSLPFHSLPDWLPSFPVVLATSTTV